MSLAALLERIQAEGEASAGEINTRAEAQAAQILAQAELEAARLYQQAEHSAAQSNPGELAHRINQARFSRLCEVGQARDALVEQVLEDVRRQLMVARRQPGYPAMLARLLAELRPPQHNTNGQGTALILEADPLDQPVLERILSDLHQQATVDYCLVCWGGLNARSPDGRVRILNTLESRLSHATPYLRQELAKLVTATITHA
jgi:vacuolar-type H+-ATPase subunit E/Vma4